MKVTTKYCANFFPWVGEPAENCTSMNAPTAVALMFLFSYADVLRGARQAFVTTACPITPYLQRAQ